MHDQHHQNPIPLQEIPTTPATGGASNGAGPSTGRSRAKASAPGVAKDLRRQGAPEEGQHAPADVPSPVRAADEAADRRAPRRRAADDVHREKTLTARFSDDERAEIEAEAKRRGIAMARLIAHATMHDVRGITAPAAPQRTALDDLIDELAAARTQVSRIGTNLNQIAFRINSGDTPRTADLPVLAAVRQALGEARQLIGDIDATATKAAARSRR